MIVVEKLHELESKEAKINRERSNKASTNLAKDYKPRRRYSSNSRSNSLDYFLCRGKY